MTTSEQITGMRFPPPVAFGAALALGFLLQHFINFRIINDSHAYLLRLIGILFAAFGMVLAASAILTFRRAHTTIRPDRSATAIVTSGPFRFSRNPMYVGLSFLHVGISLIANSVWPLILIIPALLVIRYYVIAREERDLLAKFGSEYQAYIQLVRRWL